VHGTYLFGVVAGIVAITVSSFRYSNGSAQGQNHAAREEDVPAKFVLSKARGGKFRFELLASNGKVLAQSLPHETKRAAMAALKSVQKNATTDVVDDQSEPVKATAAKTTGRKTAARKTTARGATKSAAATTGRKTTTRKTAAASAGSMGESATGAAAGSAGTAGRAAPRKTTSRATTARKRVPATAAMQS
jgi:uncharacterized protein YegP (UPF0339 family)